MLYKDNIHGEIEITEPVILEIINCPVMQRLKGIDQAGYFEPYFPGTKHNRFDHSLGVYALLSKFGASLEERISGLIHDVSHSAFSHCADYVFAEGDEKGHAHQDNVHDSFVRNSEIAGIIEKSGFELEHILNDKNFPLKENELPDICADRIDYSLRTAWHFRNYASIDAERISHILDNLTVDDGDKWVFRNHEAAREFADLFNYLNRFFYSGIESAVMFRTVGDYLRHAIKNGYIAKEEMYATDETVLGKINQHLAKDKKLSYLFDRMNNKYRFENDSHDFESQVFCKSRVIDPLCRVGDKLQRVSEIDEDWKKTVQEEMKPKEYYLKFID